ncbi:helix-turn-helix domain protein [Exiguobacterium phage vB_EalM-137]|nr:helix-turn-helix domain protein [Exiguobacterium phage vB_EalM-137]
MKGIIYMEMVINLDEYVDIGERLKTARLAKDLSLSALSEIVNIDKGALSRMERNKQGITIPQQIEICRALGITSDYLIGLVDDPTMTHEEYIKSAQEKYKFIGDVFTEELLQSLSQERLEKIVNYIKEQAIMAQLDQTNDDNK